MVKEFLVVNKVTNEVEETTQYEMIYTGLWMFNGISISSL